uniref:RNA replicase n=1 Tax=Beihai noda-like virus 10 TaxID=1922463 RepID=A0A1L3KFZ4_9VIRU|nr:hypothetical protein 1 [Beihai noda-like virus 10]
MHSHKLDRVRDNLLKPLYWVVARKRRHDLAKAGILTRTPKSVSLRVKERITGWAFTEAGLSQRAYRTGLTKNQFINALRPTVEPFTGRLAKTHDHPQSAALRNAAGTALAVMCRELGFSQHAIQAAECEARGAVTQTNRYFWLRDVVREHSNEAPASNACITMVDVDYYMDMPALLASGLPVVVYTMIPEKAADRCEDYTYRFEGDTLIADSGGGVVYRHKLWDYTVDNVTAANKRGVTCYDVFRLRLAPNRYIVGFVPRVRVPMAACLNTLSYPPELKRRVVERGDVTCVSSIADPTKVSLALQAPQAYTSIAIRVELLYLLERRLSTLHERQRAIDVSDTARWLESMRLFRGEEAQVAAHIMVSYCSGKRVKVSEVGLDSFVPEGDGDGKAPGVAFAPPLVEQPALAAVRAPAQDITTVKERIIAPSNTKKVPVGYGKYAVEFVNLLVPQDKAHTGVPLDLREVIEHQIKPMQKMRNQRHGPWQVCPDMPVARLAVKAFQKAEPYGKPKPARNISSLPVDHTLALSGYLLSMKREVLSKHEWFGPGRDCAEITDLVARITAPGDVVARDFSNFDATISEWVFKHVVLPSCKRWVSLRHIDTLTSLLTRETNAIASTKFGVRYEPGFGRLSGSPTTSDHNTIVNAFVSYCGFRNAGRSVRHSWSSLGIYYGDDSLESYPPSLDPSHQAAASDLGFDVKTARVDGPIPFLGRYFVGHASFADPWRTMAKLHASYSNSDGAPIHFANRIAGYAVTDSQTPIIGPWVIRALELLRDAGHVPKMDRMCHDDWWRFTRAWPQDGNLRDSFLAVTGMSGAEMEHYEKLIRDAQTVESFPTIPATSAAGFREREGRDGMFVRSEPVPGAPKMIEARVETHGNQEQSNETAAGTPEQGRTTFGESAATTPTNGFDGTQVPLSDGRDRDSSQDSGKNRQRNPVKGGGGPRRRRTNQNLRRTQRTVAERVAGQPGQALRQVPVHPDAADLATSNQPNVRRERRSLVRSRPITNQAGELLQRQRTLQSPHSARGRPRRNNGRATPTQAAHVVHSSTGQRLQRQPGRDRNRLERHTVELDPSSHSIHAGTSMDRVPVGTVEPVRVMGHDGVERTVHQEALRRRRQRRRQRQADARRALKTEPAVTTE